MTCTKINIQTQRFINLNLLTMLYVVDKKKTQNIKCYICPWIVWESNYMQKKKIFV